MSAPDIQTALVNAYVAAVGAPNVALTAWPNKRFDTAGKAKWLAFHFLPIAPEVHTLGGSAGEDRAPGLLQIDVNLKPDTGDAAAREIYGLLRSYFTAGRALSHASAVVTVRSCGQSGAGRHVDNFYRISFVIKWESRIPRN